MNHFIDWINGCSVSWWKWVVPAFWQAAIVVLVIVGIVTLGRRWPSPLRYGLLLVALLKFAVPPNLPFPTGIFAVVGSYVTSTGASSPLATVADQVTPPTMPLTSKPVFGENAVGAEKNSTLSWRSWLMLAHLAGFLCLLGWLTRQWLWMQALKQEGLLMTMGDPVDELRLVARKVNLNVLPDLYCSDRVIAPLAFGVARPSIILPKTILEGLSLGELRTVLAHEAAHFRRRDLIVNMAQLFLVAVWWFHPLCWLLNRAIRRVREDCCDDLLLSAEVTSREEYCAVLVRAAREMTAVRDRYTALALGESLHPVAARLIRIMDQSQKRSARLSMGGIIVTLVTASVFLPGSHSGEPAPSSTDATPALKIERVRLDPNTLKIEAAEARARGAAMAIIPPEPVPPEVKALSTEELISKLTSERRGRDFLVREAIERRAEAIPKVLKLFTDSRPNTESRRTAVNALALFAGELRWEAGDQVLAALVSVIDDPTSGEIAVRTIGALGRDGVAAAPALLIALKNGNGAAADALLKVRGDSPEVIAKLLNLLRQEATDISTRTAIAVAFSRNQLVENGNLLEEGLLQAALSPDRRLARKIAYALLIRDCRGPEAIALMKQFFADPVQTRLAGRGEYTDLSLKELIEYIRHPRAEFEDSDAAEELQFHLPAAVEAIPALIEMLRDQRRSRPSAAARTLALMGADAKPALDALTDFVNGSSFQRFEAIVPLTVISIASHDPRVIGVLARALGDQDQTVRREAVRAFRMAGRLAPAPSVAKLLPLLADKDSQIQFWAAAALWTLDKSEGEKLIPVLVNQLENEPRSRHDLEAARLLGEMGVQARLAVPALRRVSEDGTRTERIRTEARQALEKIGPETAL